MSGKFITLKVHLAALAIYWQLRDFIDAILFDLWLLLPLSRKLLLSLMIIITKIIVPVESWQLDTGNRLENASTISRLQQRNVEEGGGKVEGSDNNSLIHLNRNKQETKYEGQLGVEQTIENN